LAFLHIESAKRKISELGFFYATDNALHARNSSCCSFNLEIVEIRFTSYEVFLDLDLHNSVICLCRLCFAGDIHSTLPGNRREQNRQLHGHRAGNASDCDF
jgi:hypothetical protein